MIYLKMKLHIFISLSILVMVACNPEKHHKALAIFFDGVPEPARESPAIIDSLASGKDSLEQISGDQESATSKIFVSTHPAYKPNQCSQCHDVKHSYRLNQRQPVLCYHCHKEFKNRYKKLHGPVAAGYCTSCHVPHQSEYKHLLKHPARENCQYCHHAGDVARNSAHDTISEIECMQCHNPHGGEDKFFLINQ